MVTAAKPAMPGSLAEALAALQAELPPVGKHATADAGRYTYAYAPGESITPVLYPLMGALGLSFTAAPTLMDDGARFVLDYQLRHVSGESVTGLYPLPDPDRYGPQDLGKAITYARRYALCSLVGLFPGGDDDDAASVPKTDARKVTTQRQARAQEERAIHDRAGHDPAKVTRTRGRKVSGTDEDPWANFARAVDKSTGEVLTDPEDKPGSINPRQHRAIEMLLTRQGLSADDRAERHEAVMKLLDLPEMPPHPTTGAPSMLGLSYSQAADVIKMLSEGGS